MLWMAAKHWLQVTSDGETSNRLQTLAIGPICGKGASTEVASCALRSCKNQSRSPSCRYGKHMAAWLMAMVTELMESRMIYQNIKISKASAVNQNLCKQQYTSQNVYRCGGEIQLYQRS